MNYLNYQLKNIILWGFSLGSGPSIEMCSNYKNIGGIILQAPLASIFVWTDKNASWDFDCSPDDIYCNIGKINKINAKIFIFHGKKDKIIDVRHSYLLFEKYTQSQENNGGIWMVIAENSGHNDLHLLVEDINSPFSKRIAKFIEMVETDSLLEGIFDCIEKSSSCENQNIFNEVNNLKLKFLGLKINEPNYDFIKETQLYFTEENKSYSSNNSEILKTFNDFS